ncbi:protocadherin Fat 1-like, partial [Centruroides sculpturatus]|uniref:protocadherin Fat 1-like n=1 Tax=Centruroides sculpturatus TaxID=218467 RepID=UPI000C6E5592
LYSASVESQKKFHIDSTQGIVSIAGSLDHELCRKHILTVMVNDYGTPAKRDFARVIINVFDHNDYTPEFLLPRYEAFILETSALGATVIEVKAIDRDRGKNAQLSYSITSGNIGNFFTIDSVFGIIKVSKQLNRNSMPEFFLTIRVTDHGNPPLNNSVTVHIIVTVANNAPPKFDHHEYMTEIYENEKPGTSVAVLVAASQSSVFYEIISGNINEHFSINPTSGVIYTNFMLDYELRKLYNLTIQATNLVNGNSTAILLIHVLDRNDNQPVFHHSEYKGKIQESLKAGSIVWTNESYPLVVSASDNDSGLNSMLSYRINEKFDNEYFKIDHNTGAIRTKLPLDYEEINEFIFTVQVVDHGWPQLSAEVPAIVHVSVININDRPPVFEKSIYSTVLLLPTYEGVLIKSVHAFDPDSDIIKYSIISGNWGQKFSINEISGDIYVKNYVGLNKEYNLVISANDGKFEAKSKVIIIVEDIQPSSKHFSQEIYRVSVLENVTDSHVLTAVNIIGTQLDEHVFFKILNPTDKFDIGKTSGVIRTTGLSLDRETCNSYPLVIEARSKHSEEMWVAHTIVNITILDVNDNKPIFINTPYYATVQLEALPGNLILKVKAIDLDLNANGKVHYELLQGDYNLFRLDSDTGEIFLHASLDGQQKEYELIISAVDGGNPPLSNYVVVPVKVINRAMPIFNKHFYNVSVKEDISTKVPIFTISASNPEGRQLIYSLVDGSNIEDFQLDFNAGIMYAAEELDYETTQQYQLTLRATDAVSGIYAEIPIYIHIEDVNDNPPMFTQPVYNTTISEAMPFGTSVLVVRATDRDSKENQQIRYQIQGNASSNFHIDEDEGIVFIKQPLDHEIEEQHHFVVIGTDKGTPHLSSTAHIWIIVKDINDNPPLFHYPTYSCTISENARHGQFVTRVTAIDPDVTDQELLRYSIVSGNGMQVFAVNYKTGIITLSNRHQFSQQYSYFLNISVTDGVFSSYTRVHISVFSANLYSPHFTRTIYEVALQENQDIGTYVTTVTARDTDTGEYGRVTYRIQSDLLQEYFHIIPDTGKIYTSAVLDREKVQLFEIPVIAIDGGNKISYSMVRVTVTDDNDNTPQFVASQYKATLAANTTIGTTILKVFAVDVDDRPSGSLDFSIYDSNISSNTEIFGITSTNGEIYLKKKIADFGNHYFQFFVRAQDQGTPSKFSVVPVTIHLLASLVNIPQFEQTSIEYFVSEQAPIGTIISILNVSNPTSVPIVYSIIAAPEESMFKSYTSIFSINKLGHLLLMSELDREQETTYFLTIEAKTKIKPYILTYVNLIIHVMDENDNPPVFEASSYHIIVAENIEEGSSVLKIMAHDSDVGQNADVVYKFADDFGEAVSMFHLNSKTGWLTTINLLDRETISWYNFTVIAEDNGFPMYSSSASVIIQLQDYNDNPPKFQLQKYTSSVAEDALPGTVLVRLEIIDADENIDNSIEYYITDGNPKNQFDIRQTGELFVSKLLDREDIASYFLEITITDGTFISQTTVDIEIIDVNDNPPVCLKVTISSIYN